jgi:acyl carrier protein
LVSDSSGIAARVRELLAQVLEVQPSSIGPESSPATIASWTSLNHLMLVSQIENEFGVVFSNEQIRDLVSFDQIVRTVAGQMGPGSLG